jgi:transcriptional regulator with XRE-family HTH domain
VSQIDPQNENLPERRHIDMDRYVSNRMRERRIMMGLSQPQLARMIGVTCTQAHKYERGLNRITVGRLFEIAQALAVPPEWFFEGFGDIPEASPPG